MAYNVPNRHGNVTAPNRMLYHHVLKLYMCVYLVITTVIHPYLANPQ